MFYVHETCKFLICKISKVMQQHTSGVVVTYYGFCWKFSALCSSERILQIDQELTKL